MKLGTKPCRNTKDKPTCHSPSFVQPASTHTRGWISSGSLTPVLDVSHVHSRPCGAISRAAAAQSNGPGIQCPASNGPKSQCVANSMTRCFFLYPPRRRYPPNSSVHFPDITILRTLRPWPAHRAEVARERGSAGSCQCTTASSLSHATKAAKAMRLVSSRAEEWI